MNPSKPSSSAKNRRTNPRHEDSAAGSATAGPERSTRDITVGLSSVAIEECGDYRTRLLCSCCLPYAVQQLCRATFRLPKFSTGKYRDTGNSPALPGFPTEG